MMTCFGSMNCDLDMAFLKFTWKRYFLGIVSARDIRLDPKLSESTKCRLDECNYFVETLDLCIALFSKLL